MNAPLYRYLITYHMLHTMVYLFNMSLDSFILAKLKMIRKSTIYKSLCIYTGVRVKRKVGKSNPDVVLFL